MSKPEPGTKISHRDPDNGKLLHDIEAVSKALYLGRNSSRITASTATSRGKSINRSDGLVADSVPSTRWFGGTGAADQPPSKDKKSFWNWKPLKALSHARSRRFNCCFTLQVHNIKNLPPSFNGASLCVCWKRRDGEVVTNPAKVVQGTADFEERLSHTCAVHANRRGPHHSAKYEAKHCLLFARVRGNIDFDLGKHRVDLTRLLPLTFEEMEGEKSSGKWTTSFKLQGEATGAVMNVSFGYLVLPDTIAPPPNDKNILELLGSKQNEVTPIRTVMRGGDVKVSVQRSASLPNDTRLVSSSHPEEDIKVLNEVLPAGNPNLSDSIRLLHEKFEEGKLVDCVSEPVKPISLFHTDSCKENTACPYNNMSVVEKGIDVPQEDKVQYNDNATKVGGGSDLESLDHVLTASEAGSTLQTKANFSINELSENFKEVPMNNCSTCSKESLLEELESALNVAEDLGKAGNETPETESEFDDLENATEMKSDVAESSFDLLSAENEFLSLLGIEGSPSGLCLEDEDEGEGEDGPDSPRERLLREFEKEAEACGYTLFDFGTGGEEEEYDYDAPSTSEWGTLSEAVELPSISEFGGENQFLGQEGSYHAPRAPVWDNFMEEFELPLVSPEIEDEDYSIDIQECRVKPRAKVLEGLETEALMREWGLNEKAFESSPPRPNAGAGCRVDIQAEEPSTRLPPLGEGLSPFLQTENGGFLRSMDPSLFRNSKIGGSLIMQVSRPVVVPAEMGSDVIEILENLASIGLEKLSLQAHKLMPLEDINGKTMERMAWEATPKLEGHESHDVIKHSGESGLATSVARRIKGHSSRVRSNSHISSRASDEFVSLEDLAPLAIEKIEALSVEGLRIQSGMSEEEAPSNIIAKSRGVEGAVGLQLLDIRDSDDTVEGLMDMSLTLDEWMKLDSGEIDEEELSERTSKVLAAHRATYTGAALGKREDRKKGKGSRGRCGLFGNNFTVALMVQLRDPLRDYEPVGTPMLALMQVERVFVPPKAKIYGTVSDIKNNNNGEEDDEPSVAPKVESVAEEKKEKGLEEELVPQYKVAEVHVTGLQMKPEPGKKKLWGSAAQQQSGSRWLLANGMGKKSHNLPLLKSKVGKPSQATIVAQSGDTLWSISTRVLGTGSKWKELAALNPHVRNPNVVIPKETVIRLR